MDGNPLLELARIAQEKYPHLAGARLTITTPEGATMSYLLGPILTDVMGRPLALPPPLANLPPERK